MDNFAMRIQKNLEKRGIGSVSAMMITLIGLTLIFTLIITIIFGGGSYLLELESAKENLNLSLLINVIFIIFLTGSIILSFFEDKE